MQQQYLILMIITWKRKVLDNFHCTGNNNKNNSTIFAMKNLPPYYDCEVPSQSWKWGWLIYHHHFLTAVSHACHGLWHHPYWYFFARNPNIFFFFFFFYSMGFSEVWEIRNELYFKLHRRISFSVFFLVFFLQRKQCAEARFSFCLRIFYVVFKSVSFFKNSYLTKSNLLLQPGPWKRRWQRL